MRIFKRLIIVLIFLLVIFGGIGAYKYYQIQQMTAQMSQPQPPATISSATAESVEWTATLAAVGSLQAINGVRLTTEIPGTVSEIRFESGQRVKQGDVLVQIDASVDKAALEGLIADRELARMEFQRAQNLLPQRAVSQSQFDEAEAKYQSAQARVAQQQAQIAKKSIKAPFDGLLGLRQVDRGEYLTPGAEIVSLQTLDPIYLDYSVPEQRFQYVKVGQTVRARLDAYSDEVFQGRVTAIDSGINEGTRSLRVRATLDNPGGRLRQGMFAEVETVRDETQQVITIPRTAISYNTYGDFVFLIEEGDNAELSAQRQQVTVGQTRDGRVEVTEGLKAGQRVVRAGLVKLRNGQPVTIDDSVALQDQGSAQP